MSRIQFEDIVRDGVSIIHMRAIRPPTVGYMCIIVHLGLQRIQPVVILERPSHLLAKTSFLQFCSDSIIVRFIAGIRVFRGE
jgi:hypothetical protein